jgi:hypothetical protein
VVGGLAVGDLAELAREVGFGVVQFGEQQADLVHDGQLLPVSAVRAPASFSTRTAVTL